MVKVVMPINDEVDRSMDQARTLVNLYPKPELLTVIHSHAFDHMESDDEMTNLKSVQQVMSFFDDHGISYELRADQNEPTAFVDEILHDTGADNVCVGGSKQSPVGKALFVNVSQ